MERDPRNRLTRSRNRMVAGVCSGIAEFFGWPVERLRVVVALATILTGVVPGVVAYMALCLLMPPDDAGGRSSFDLNDFRRQ